MTTRTFGYVRVSTKDQNEDRQLLALASYHIPPGNLYIDKQSGKDFNRPAYRRMLRRLRAQDLVLIKSIDRLGRNYQEIIDQWKNITRIIGADIFILDMPLLDTRRDKNLLGAFISDLVLQVLSFVSQTERESIRQRQAEGIAAARIRGVTFGRPNLPIPNAFYEQHRRWENGEINSRIAAKNLNVSQTTFLKWSKLPDRYQKHTG